jgi:hypothetical protein
VEGRGKRNQRTEVRYQETEVSKKPETGNLKPERSVAELYV